MKIGDRPHLFLKKKGPGSNYFADPKHQYIIAIMPYSDFTLKKVKEELNLKVIENRDMFSHIKEMEVSDILSNILKYNVPLAVAIGTAPESARTASASVAWVKW